MGAGGVIIIRRNMRVVAEMASVQEQLGPLKQARLGNILSKDESNWTAAESRFVARCILDAVEAYEE